MFGAPPVGHVMDPQFKPVFFGVMEICMQMHVVSTLMAGFTCTYPYT